MGRAQHAWGINPCNLMAPSVWGRRVGGKADNVLSETMSLKFWNILGQFSGTGQYEKKFFAHQNACFGRLFSACTPGLCTFSPSRHIHQANTCMSSNDTSGAHVLHAAHLLMPLAVSNGNDNRTDLQPQLPCIAGLTICSRHFVTCTGVTSPPP